MAHSESIQSIIEKFGTDKAFGLSAKNVELSIKKYGANSILPKKEKSILSRIISALLEPMMIILLIAFTVTVGVNIGKALVGSDASFFECLGIFIAIGISVSLTVIMEGRSNKAFQMLNKISDDVKVKVVRDGEILLLNQKQIVCGDIIYLSSGDKVVADCRLISSNALETDESMLTGESNSVKKDSACVLKKKTPLAERKNCVYSGTFITSGDAVAVVFGVGENAEIGKIATDLNKNPAISAPLNEKLSKLGKVVSLFGGISATLVFVLSLIRLIVLNDVSFDSVQNIFIESIILIVAAVPEGLPSTVAISLTLNVVRLAKSNALIKKLVATETIGSVSVICSDKTGTLTQNKMVVTEIVTPSQVFSANQFTQRYLVLNACVNSTADVVKGEIKGSKTEGALLASLKQSGINYKKVRQSATVIEQVPFSSVIKYMKTVAMSDGEKVTLVKGAPEIVLAGCSLSSSKRTEIEGKIKAYQAKAKRVIAFSHSVDSAMVFDGFCVLEDKLRDDVVDAVKSCFSAGVKVKMLTGDNIVTALAVADKLGIGNGYGRVVSGDEIESYTEEKLIKEIAGISVVARSTPNVKLRIVKALQSLGEVVAVTGDGVNDAPAIKNADIGIAMGEGSEITKESSDVVLLDNSFSTIITAISFGRNIFRNFQRFITFQLTVNLSSMCIIIFYLMMGMESPFSSTCLLWLNVIMDGPLALSLGLEKAGKNILKHKPVRRSEDILSGKILFRVVLHSLFTAGVVVLQEMYNFLGCTLVQKHTVTFATFVIFQLFNAINCRQVYAGSALKGITGNKLLLIVGVLTFILQIIITEFIPSFFGTVSLGGLLWLKITLLCSSIVLLSEGYKLIYRVLKSILNQTKNKKTKSVFGT